MSIKGLIKGTLIFLAGIGVGYLVADTIKSEQYARQARDEINEVKAIYKEKLAEGKKSQNNSETEKVEEETTEEFPKEDIVEYKTLTKKYDYNKIYANKEEKKDEHKEEESRISDLNYVTYDANEYDRPYIINEENYGEIEEYDTLQLTYFIGDKKLVDEDADDIVDEPDLHVGLDNLKIFDEFPECTGIYVRNDVLKIDFEILKDDFCYEDMIEKEYPEEQIKEKKPHQI